MSVFLEDFEHNMGAETVKLINYIGAQGTTYSGAAPWQDAEDCNNIILRYQDPIWQSGFCAPSQNDPRLNVQRMADVLGQVDAGVPGSANRDTPQNGSTAVSRLNHAVSAFTYTENMANNLVVLESTSLPDRLIPGHFYTSSIDVAELSCEYAGGVNNSQLDFTLNVDGVDRPLQDDPIRACTDPRVAYYDSPQIDGQGWGSGGSYVAAGRFYSDRSFLMPQGVGESRLEMRNRIGNSQGNDFAYDNFELVDATPQLDKSFSPALVTVGDNSTLTFIVTNSSDLAEKNGWSFTDTLPAGLVVAPGATPGGTCVANVNAPAGGNSIAITDGVLAEGDVSCTITIDVTSTDTIVGNAPPVAYENCAENISGAVGVLLPACATVEFAPVPSSSLSIVKSSQTEGVTSEQTVTYEFLVTNTGNTTLTDVKPSETEFTGVGTVGAFSPESVTLTPGASQVFTADYVVQPGDLLLDAIDNTAVATGLDPDRVPVESDPSDWDIQIDTWGQLVLEKTANVTLITEDMVGQTITYSFEVTNIGTAEMTDVRPVEMSFNGSGTMGAFSPTSATLAPNGGTQVFTAEYVITEDDVRLQSLDNVAYATGVEPDGSTEDSPPDNVEVPVQPFDRLELVKTSDVADIDVTMIGDTIIYSFEVTNTGTSVLTNVTPVEVEFNGTGDLGAFSPGPVTLNPGESRTFTAPYVIQEDDLWLTELTNTAIAEGTPPGSETPVPSPPDDNVIIVDTFGALEIVKTASFDVITLEDIGSTITYTFVVTNTGTSVMENVTPVEDDFNGAGELGDFSPGPVTLAPGESRTFTADYVIQAADVEGESLLNTAYATGNEPGLPPVDSPPDEVEIPIEPFDRLEIEKTSDAETITREMVGETITYSFLVTNTGKTVLTDVTPVEVEFNGSGELGEFQPGPVTLQPGESRVFIAAYVIAEEDLRLDPMVLTNVAIAEGTPPGGGERVPSPPDENEINIEPFGELSIEKTSDITTLTADSVGDVITYSFLVTNTGTAPLDDVYPVDVDFSGFGELGEISPGPVSLQPGDSQVFTAQYTVTYEDVLSESLTNTAYATGTDPSDPEGPSVESPPDENEINVEWTSSLSIEKTANVTSISAEGEVVTYSFLVTNTGTAALTNVKPVEVEFSGTGTLGPITPDAVDLLPGESQMFTAEYRVTAADIAHGKLENTAVATGTNPDGDPVGSPESKVKLVGPGGLAATGSDAAALGLVGGLALLLMLSGVGAMMWNRRRSEA